MANLCWGDQLLVTRLCSVLQHVMKKVLKEWCSQIIEPYESTDSFFRSYRASKYFLTGGSQASVFTSHIKYIQIMITFVMYQEWLKHFK